MTTSLRDFEGAVAIVTGGSTGLGRSIAEEVARRGARAVAINFVGEEKDGEEAAAAIRALGAEAILVPGDIGEEDVCRRLVASVAQYERVDALFNNAGTTKFSFDHGDLDNISGEDFVRIYRVNVVGPYQTIRFARSLLESAPLPGAVVNTSSLAAFASLGSSIPYAASKGALNTMTIGLARALAPRIRVNAVCPGFMDTPWFRNVSHNEMITLRENVAASVPMNVASKPQDIAGPAVFLASPAAAHITGETLLVDAGMHLGPKPMQRA
jgi:3-oxoacyl-[acyl-carrier protein] reductase